VAREFHFKAFIVMSSDSPRLPESASDVVLCVSSFYGAFEVPTVAFDAACRRFALGFCGVAADLPAVGYRDHFAEG
jgi:hypothetical protein